MIMAGKILVNNQPVDKAGFLVSATDSIVLKEKDIPYVSRGGLKLEGALQTLDVVVKGCICLDVTPPPEALPIACCNMAPPAFMRWMSATASWLGN